MVQRNATGIFSTNDYVLGRGIGYAALLGSDDIPLSGLRDLGNIPTIGLNLEAQSEPHYSSRGGLRTQDAVFVTSQNVSGNISMESATLENLALYLSGSIAVDQGGVGPHNNAAGYSIAVWDQVKPEQVLGRWLRLYDMDHTNALAKRVYSLKKAGGGTATIKVFSDATEITGSCVFDLANGMVFIKHDATLAGYTATTKKITWRPETVSTDTITSKKFDELRIFDTASQNFAFLFHGENANNSNVRFELFLPKVSFTPNGEAGLITETEAIQIPMTMSIQPNETGFPATPYGWVRSYAIAS